MANVIGALAERLVNNDQRLALLIGTVCGEAISAGKPGTVKA